MSENKPGPQSPDEAHGELPEIRETPRQGYTDGAETPPVLPHALGRAPGAPRVGFTIPEDADDEEGSVTFSPGHASIPQAGPGDVPEDVMPEDDGEDAPPEPPPVSLLDFLSEVDPEAGREAQKSIEDARQQQNTAHLPKPVIEAAMEVTAEENQRDTRRETAKAEARQVYRRRRRAVVPDSGHGCLVAIGYAALILGLSMALSAMIILFANEVFAFVKPDVTAVIEVTRKDDFESISEKLGEAGIIRYPSLFNLYLNIAKSGEKFTAGRYEVSAKLDYAAIVRTMRPSTVRETVRVTIPEGYTTAQIVTLLEQNKVCGTEELYRAIATEQFDYDWLDTEVEGERRLEGYLFPDTYEFYVGDTPRNVLTKFLDNFDAKYTPELQQAVKKSGHSLREVIIIASMIEREAKLDDERRVIASVIENRMASPDFEYLQIDATVAYVVGRAPTDADLDIDDPYNTYMYKGLPPGPISNPGQRSIEAAMNPADTEYYFYVARRDGSHQFSKTAEEHAQAIAELQGDQ